MHLFEPGTLIHMDKYGDYSKLYLEAQKSGSHNFSHQSLPLSTTVLYNDIIMFTYTFSVYQLPLW